MTRGSIIIPVRNDPVRLVKLLDSFAAEDWEAHEVLVIDDGSTDDTATVAAAYPLRVVRNAGPAGPSGARNFGAAAASEQTLVFIDSDVVLGPGAISRVMGWFDDPRVVGVSTIASEEPENPGFVARYSAVSDKYVCENWDRSSAEGHVKTGVRQCRWLSTRFGAIRRPVFDEIGGFDVRIDRPSIEDAEFSIRLAGRYSLVLDLDVPHTHHWPTRIGQVLQKTFRNSLLVMRVLRDRDVPPDHAVPTGERVARILCGLAVLLLFTVPFSAVGATASAVSFGVSAWLYRDLFVAYGRAGGSFFLLGAALLHYVVTCAGLAGAAIGIVTPSGIGRVKQGRA